MAHRHVRTPVGKLTDYYQWLRITYVGGGLLNSSTSEPAGSEISALALAQATCSEYSLGCLLWVLSMAGIYCSHDTEV